MRRSRNSNSVLEDIHQMNPFNLPMPEPENYNINLSSDTLDQALGSFYDEHLSTRHQFQDLYQIPFQSGDYADSVSYVNMHSTPADLATVPLPRGRRGRRVRSARRIIQSGNGAETGVTQKVVASGMDRLRGYSAFNTMRIQWIEYASQHNGPISNSEILDWWENKFETFLINTN